jgi:hypothetical protein
MNVDRALADDMMKVAPENIRYLTPSDLNQYGLLGTTPDQAYFTPLPLRLAA